MSSRNQIRPGTYGKGGDSYFAENGNRPIFMAENENVTYISTDFGHKNSDGNEDIILRVEKRKLSI